MTFPVFASGDVLNASDMNAVGLWKIASGSFTAATSFSLPNGTFTSAYRNYKIIAQITAATTAVNITGRIRNGGSDVTTARYFQMSVGLTQAAGASNQAESATSSYALGASGGSAAPAWSLDLNIYQPNVSTIWKPIAGALTFDTAGTYVGRAINGTFDNSGVASTYDSFSIIASSANSITGVYYVYGFNI